MADNEDLQEFIDEYVSDVISSAITEVSMTTDSGVDEGCDDSEVTQLAVSSNCTPRSPHPLSIVHRGIVSKNQCPQP